MRIIVSCATAIALAVALLAACNSNDGGLAGKPNRGATNGNNAAAAPAPSDGVRRVTVTELKEKVDKGSVLIVDVRAPEAYALEHIKGSINIPENNVVARAGELPQDKEIVTYCS